MWLCGVVVISIDVVMLRGSDRGEGGVVMMVAMMRWCMVLLLWCCNRS